MGEDMGKNRDARQHGQLAKEPKPEQGRAGALQAGRLDSKGCVSWDPRATQKHSRGDRLTSASRKQNPYPQ